MNLGIDGTTIYIEVKPDKDSLIRRLADIEIMADNLKREAHRLCSELKGCSVDEAVEAD